MPYIQDKTDSQGQFLTAVELNPFKNSLQNAITDAGGTLIESDSLQFRQALNSYSSIANFYIDTGTATEYVLNPQGAFKTPIDAPTTWNGMLIRFRPTNNNTGVTTLRLAGLNGGLPSNTLREDGTAIQEGDFSTTRDAILRYNSTAGAFMLLNSNLYALVSKNLQAQKPILLSYNSETVVNYSAGGVIFDDYTGSATVTAGTINLATNGLNGFDTGTLPTTGWVYTYAIYNPTTGVSGLLASLSSTTPTLPSGFTKKSRIRNGLIRISSSQIQLFSHYKNEWISTNQIVVTSQLNVVNYTNSALPTIPLKADLVSYFSLTAAGQSTQVVWGNLKPWTSGVDGLFLAQNNGFTNATNGYIYASDGVIRATNPTIAGGVGNSQIILKAISEL